MAPGATASGEMVSGVRGLSALGSLPITSLSGYLLQSWQAPRCGWPGPRGGPNKRETGSKSIAPLTVEQISSWTPWL